MIGKRLAMLAVRSIVALCRVPYREDAYRSQCIRLWPIDVMCCGHQTIDTAAVQTNCLYSDVVSEGPRLSVRV